jgi:hypothetical protein
MVQQWILSVAMHDTERNRKLIDEAIKHDWLLYRGQMKAPTVSEWLRFLINRRLTEIRDGRV